MELEFVVENPTELKTFLFEKGFSKRAVSKLLLEKKNVYINGILYGKDFSLKKGDKVVILQSENTTVLPSSGQIDIVFEDEYILVVNKPKNLAVIPTKAHYTDNLSGRVLYYYKSNGINSGIHVVNRLDIVTSGLVVFAKSAYIHSILAKETITKKYRCTVTGKFDCKSGVIKSKIHKTENGIKREVATRGKDAETRYEVIKEYANSSLLDIELITGRTHQIRSHMASISHPLIGDKLYGGENGEFDLRSYYVSFSLPINNKKYEFNI